jgi:hypothetical protein
MRLISWTLQSGSEQMVPYNVCALSMSMSLPMSMSISMSMSESRTILLMFINMNPQKFPTPTVSDGKSLSQPACRRKWKKCKEEDE